MGFVPNILIASEIFWLCTRYAFSFLLSSEFSDFNTSLGGSIDTPCQFMNQVRRGSDRVSASEHDLQSSQCFRGKQDTVKVDAIKRGSVSKNECLYALSFLMEKASGAEELAK